jgi:hypothetical protein
MAELADPTEPDAAPLGARGIDWKCAAIWTLLADDLAAAIRLEAAFRVIASYEEAGGCPALN